ncbi:MAG: vanadium-dependent haloperoxidase [Pseudomonadota bacterium]
MSDFIKRREDAERIRGAAAEDARKRNTPLVQHTSNGDEVREGYSTRPPASIVDPIQDIPGLVAMDSSVDSVSALETDTPFLTFSKGLLHDDSTGLVVGTPATGFSGARPGEASTVVLRAAINQPKVAPYNHIRIANDGRTVARFFGTPHGQEYSLATIDAGHLHRRWEAPTAGYVYDLQGPDAQAVTMPAAPSGEIGAAGNVDPELVAEMAEIYWLGLLRDVPFAEFSGGFTGAPYGTPSGATIADAIDHLRGLPFYSEGPSVPHPNGQMPGQDHKAASVRPTTLGAQNIFRGQTPGDDIGPYLSQFLLIGNDGTGGPTNSAEDGLIAYGSIRVDQKVREALQQVDYMTVWNEYLDVQDGANVTSTQAFAQSGTGADKFRFIATPRDLATYVHFDALYEAYLNACLWLLSSDAPFDPDFDQVSDGRAVQGFALYGGPHILSLVTEVATRALKAVRFQKFNVHLRARPEALAGLVAAGHAGTLSGNADAFAQAMKTDLGASLIDKVRAHNGTINAARPNMTDYLAAQGADIAKADDLPLLPMAFPEGSPMHPAYGAGHATVAGACVTILKAFFDEDAVLVKDKALKNRHIAVSKACYDKTPDRYQAFSYEAAANGLTLDLLTPQAPLSVGHELNKLASNISIGRNMAGVHYYSDYIHSMIMGEEIAIGILSEQALSYEGTESLLMKFRSFTDKEVCIGSAGGVHVRAIS